MKDKKLIKRGQKIEKIGTGMIRKDKNYNFPQGRVTDHRLI